MSWAMRSFCLCFGLNKCITSPKVWADVKIFPLITFDTSKFRNVEVFSNPILKMGNDGEDEGSQKSGASRCVGREAQHLQHPVYQNQYSSGTKCRPQLPVLYRHLHVLFFLPSTRSAPFSTRVSPSQNNMPRPRTNSDYRALPSPRTNSKPHSGIPFVHRCINTRITAARMFSEANMGGQGSGGKRWSGGVSGVFCPQTMWRRVLEIPKSIFLMAWWKPY